MSRGRDQFAKFKKYIQLLSSFYRILPLKMRLKLFECHRNTPGKIGLGIRYAIIKATAVSCGDNVAVYPGAYIFNLQNLKIGNNVSIHPMCYIECSNSSTVGVQIGNDVSIAHGVTIMATSHTYSKHEAKIKDQEVICSPVCIEENVWIGAKATILSGVTIASGCVVGSNAVVTHDTDKDGVYVGVPAQKIKLR